MNFWSLYFTLNVCLPLTCPLPFFHCMAHCYYSHISHALDENVALKVEKGTLSHFIRIFLVCPINWLKGTFVLQLTLLFLSQKAFIPLKGIFLSQLGSAGFSFKTIVRHFDIQRAILLSAPWEPFPANVLDQLPLSQSTSSKFAFIWPSLACSLLNSVFYQLIKRHCSLSWVIGWDKFYILKKVQRRRDFKPSTSEMCQTCRWQSWKNCFGRNKC